MEEIAKQLNDVLDQDFGKTKLQHKFLHDPSTGSGAPKDRPTATAIIDLLIAEMHERIRELENWKRKLAP